ncbi:kinase-like domain-containing protein [Halteromyces radiatus]|uniref:kinase-like domain-containing protein n=1 Tax=Halteromyces radiatus TaxID=101107 RepID=UPI00221E7809|nr:kinase-like domain-containing protein [Halteromyces radiatus]KAI8076854.1 kinase-like domain-containing protein [Halteromyces radiatus]
MTRWFHPISFQLATTSWAHSRFKTKKNFNTKYRHVKHYRLLCEISHGSTGIVYLALDTKTKQLYAIKEINAIQLQRQQGMDWLQARHPRHQQYNDGSKRRRIDTMINIPTMESDILKSLQHDNIVTWIDWFEQDDYVYLVTEWVDGSILVDLHDHEHQRSIDETTCHSIFVQLISALEYLHERHVIHCDIKPDNILLTKDQHVKLIDFGSAIQLSTGHDDKIYQRRRTPAFTAPECLMIKKKKDDAYNETAADIYSLGLTLYCMVYGNLPPLQPIDDLTRLPLWTTPASDTTHPQLVDLLDQMLKVCPFERITLDKIKSHPWVLKNDTT